LEATPWMKWSENHTLILQSLVASQCVSICTVSNSLDFDNLDSIQFYYDIWMLIFCSGTIHCNKELAVFQSPAGMSLIKLSLGGNNFVFSRSERVWSVTSRLGTGKWLTLFYSVFIRMNEEWEQTYQGLWATAQDWESNIVGRKEGLFLFLKAHWNVST
jgi:hypothetical protein